MDVSHPDSPSYGKHWSATQVAEHFAPSQDTIDAVRAWLAEEGVHPDRIRLSFAKNWIEFNATATEAEALIQAEYQVYKHRQTGHTHVGE
jgi:tripeptidyl-peptidase-1